MEGKMWGGKNENCGVGKWREHLRAGKRQRHEKRPQAMQNVRHENGRVKDGTAIIRRKTKAFLFAKFFPPIFTPRETIEETVVATLGGFTLPPTRGASYTCYE